MNIDCYLVRIMATLLDCLHPKAKTQPNRDKHMRRGKDRQRETKRETREREKIGRANTVWVQRDSRDAKTGRMWKKGKVESREIG